MKQKILNQLKNGQQFENLAADWFTLNSPVNNRRLIVIRGETREYKNLNSYADRIVKLINTGL